MSFHIISTDEGAIIMLIDVRLPLLYKSLARLSRHGLRLKGNLCELSWAFSIGPGYRVATAQLRYLACPPPMLTVVDSRRGSVIPKTIIKMVQTAFMLRTRKLG